MAIRCEVETVVDDRKPKSIPGICQPCSSINGWYFCRRHYYWHAVLAPSARQYVNIVNDDRKSGDIQGQWLAPTSSATTVALQAMFMSIMGSVSSSRSRRQGMWDLQCQPGPGHGIICKRICCSRFHARGNAPINSQDVCIDGY